MSKKNSTSDSHKRFSDTEASDKKANYEQNYNRT
jgi:hypothetical protein